MKVWELREQLKGCQDDDLVIVNDNNQTAVLQAERRQMALLGRTYPAVVMILAERPGAMTR